MNLLVNQIEDFICERGAMRINDGKYEQAIQNYNDTFRKLAENIKENQELYHLLFELDDLNAMKEYCWGEYRYKQGFSDCLKIILMACKQ